MIALSVNVDHVATLRNARGGRVPDPLVFVQEALAGGASGITVHLREDRRHIQDNDVERIAHHHREKLNLEMALTEEMTEIALKITPLSCCLVPERRQELTTEGGVHPDMLSSLLLKKLASKGIAIFLFVDPKIEIIKLARKMEGISGIELHTGYFCNAFIAQQKALVGQHLSSLKACARWAHKEKLVIHAGHGLSLKMLPLLKEIPHIDEVSIGHELITHALMVGMKTAVKQFCAHLASDSRDLPVT